MDRFLMIIAGILIALLFILLVVMIVAVPFSIHYGSVCAENGYPQMLWFPPLEVYCVRFEDATQVMVPLRDLLK